MFNVQKFKEMIKRRTLSKISGGQVWNTGGAHAPPVKQLKNTLRRDAVDWMQCGCSDH